MLKKTSENCAIVVALQNVRKHPNADRLQLATVLGTTVIVGLDAREGDIVVYFDSNLRLSHEFLHENNLYSSPELNKDTTKKGYFGKSGRVRAQKFRGEISNGFVAEVSMFNYTIRNGDFVAVPSILGTKFSDKVYDCFLLGQEFNEINGHLICEKYIVQNKGDGSKGQPKTQKPASVMFHKHWDTKQFMRELDSVPQYGLFFIEEKIHGTSGRTGLVLVANRTHKWQLWKPAKAWKVVSGTRRVDNIDYHMPQVRAEIERRVAPHLKKGETLFYEVYGYDGSKEIQAGFTYGLRPGEFKAMLYRVTMTNEDGVTIDLSRRAVYARAEELGLDKPWVTHVLFEKDPDFIKGICEGKSHLDKGTLLEGVVVWFEDAKGNWTCLKHKSEEFLLLDDRNKEKGNGDVEDIL